MAGPLDRRLLRESRAARRHLLVAGALGVAAAAVIVAQAVLLAGIIDRAALHHASLGALEGRLLALAGVLAARAAITGGFELSARLGAAGAMSELRLRLSRHLLRDGSVAPGSELRTGELAAAAVQGVDALQAYFAGYLPQLVLAAAVPVAVLGWAAAVDPIAAAILAFTIPILILFMVLVGKGAREQAARRWGALGLLSAHFLDVVKGLATLRAYGRVRAQGETLAAVGERYRLETMATLRVAFLSAFVLELCAMIGTAMAAAAIGIQLASGSLGPQAGLTVLLLAPELYGPLRQVGQQFHAALDGTGAAERILQALERPTAVSIAPGPARRPVADPALAPIVLEGVGFSYPGRPEPVLEHLDLELAPGEITALVGPSGCGKSTIARLLMRLADPDEGAVRCGGGDLREMDLRGWRGRIAWVPQRPQLFTGTVEQNLLLGSPAAADRRRIARALRNFGAEEFVAELPDGLATVVGEGGRRLSVGQRQRLALARALLRDARLLILDEPTAHLDDSNTGRIAASLAAIGGGRTTLLIVHHPALAEQAHHVHRLAPRDSRSTAVPA